MKKWFSLENLIYLTIAALPCYLLRFAIFGVPTNALEILIGIVFIFWLIEMRPVGTNNYLSLRRGMTVHKKYLIPMGLILIGLVISTIINKNYVVGLGIIKGWFILPILFVLVIYNFLPKNKVINVYKALYFSSFGVALIAFGYLFCGHLTYDGRLEGIFDSPNYLAMYLAPGVIIGVMLALAWSMEHGAWSAGVNKKIFRVSLAVIIAAFYFTYSYATWISVVLALFVILILRNKNKFSPKYATILVLVLAIIFFLVKGTAKFHDLANFSQRSSLASRVIIWKSAGKMLQDNWMAGIGPGNFQVKYLAYQRYFPPYLEWAVPHPHNLFLAFWLYSGLLGIVGFLALLIFWFRDMAKKESDVTKYIALTIVVYVLLHGLVDTTYFKNDLAVVFWLNFLMPIRIYK